MRGARAAVLATAACCLVACAHAPARPARAPVPVVPSEAPEALPDSGSATPAPRDPVAVRISRADALLSAGDAAWSDGEPAAARRAFDDALALYLDAPGGASHDPRLAAAYARTLETIHLREISALVAAADPNDDAGAAIDLLGAIPLPSVRNDDLRRVAEQNVRAQPSDFPIELNDAVLSGVALYQGALRDWFSDALVRSGRYVGWIQDAFADAGLPRDLAWAALVESAFKTQAVSRARARGIWQFMPDTARRYGLRQNAWLDERRDPFVSTRAAARYLHDLYDRFGDWNLALAAYNAGEHRIARALARLHVDDFWSLRRRRALPRETRNHVPLIHAAILIARSPQLYGFDVRPDAPVRYETLDVAHPASLAGLARCAALPADALAQLNPQLLRVSTPKGAYPLRVPAERRATLAACLQDSPRARMHVVRPGETLSEIAARYGTSVAELQMWNGLRGSRIIAGHTLAIYR